VLIKVLHGHNYCLYKSGIMALSPHQLPLWARQKLESEGAMQTFEVPGATPPQALQPPQAFPPQPSQLDYNTDVISTLSGTESDYYPPLPGAPANNSFGPDTSSASLIPDYVPGWEQRVQQTFLSRASPQREPPVATFAVPKSGIPHPSEAPKSWKPTPDISKRATEGQANRPHRSNPTTSPTLRRRSISPKMHPTQSTHE
jgi:hypothetical protein